MNETKHKKSPLRYRPEIDGLRAIAVLSVIFYHAGFPWFSGGFSGVDIFFVISGFLITSLLMDEHKNKSFSILRFYERRARRILPALFFILSLCLLFSFYALSSLQIKDFGKSLVSVSLFASNFLFWKTPSYFDASNDEKLLLHTWSLGVEEQYYIVFPLLIAVLWRFGKNKLLATIAALTLLSFGFCEWGARYNPSANFYLIPSRAWELFLGSLLALTSVNVPVRQRISPKVGSTLANIGLIFVFSSIFFLDKNTPFPSLYALLPTMGAALVIGFSDKNNFAGKFLSLKVFVGIGLISYCAYLWHQPLFAFARILTFNNVSSLVFSGLILATLVLAFLTWKFIETPFRNKSFLSQKWIFLYSIVFSAFFITAGLTLFLTPNKTALSRQPNAGLSELCDSLGNFEPNNHCTTSPSPEFLIWGDSLAMHLVAGLLASDPEIKLAQATQSTCGPILGLAPLSGNLEFDKQRAATCIDFNDSVLTYIAKQESLKTIILSSLFEQYLGEDGILSRQGVLSPSLNDLSQEAGRTIQALRQAGKKVIFFAPPPTLDFNTGDCRERQMTGKPIWRQNTSCDIEVLAYQKRKENVITLLKKIERDHNVSVIWFDDYLCDPLTCHTSFEGKPLYRDTTHFTYDGSAYLGQKMGFLKLIEKSAR